MRGDAADRAHPPDGFRTRRCVLDRLSEADRRCVARLLADPRVWRHLGGPKPEADVSRIVDEYLARSAGGGLWAVRAADGRALLGLLFLGQHHDGDDVEVSYLFAPERWGRGFATEAVAGLLDHARMKLGLRRVVAETQAANGASRRVLERLGMRPERRVVRFDEEQVIYALDLG